MFIEGSLLPMLFGGWEAKCLQGVHIHCLLVLGLGSAFWLGHGELRSKVDLRQTTTATKKESLNCFFL